MAPLTAKISNRYMPDNYNHLHQFDSLYFSGKFEHNLVCGVPQIDNKHFVENGVAEYLSRQSFGYSKVDGHSVYREQIADILAREGVSGREYIATAGGTGGILLSMMAVISSGDEVILFDPDFAAYRHLAVMLGASTVYYDLDGDYRIDPAKLRTLVTCRTKALIFSNPSNPCGTVAGRKILQDLIAIADEHGFWIIVDEVYGEFTFNNSFFSALLNPSNNIICVRSLSKSGGLGGWRIGYTVASERVISVMKDIQEYSFICPTVASQFVAASVLPHLNFLVDNLLVSVKEACQLFEHEGIDFIRPEATFFICVKAPNGSGIDFANRCYSDGVAVLPSVLFSNKDNFVRLSLAGNPDKNRAAVKRFIEIYKAVANESQ